VAFHHRLWQGDDDAEGQHQQRAEAEKLLCLFQEQGGHAGQDGQGVEQPEDGGRWQAGAEQPVMQVAQVVAHGSATGPQPSVDDVGIVEDRDTQD
jgi:hypothetical protein